MEISKKERKKELENVLNTATYNGWWKKEDREAAKLELLQILVALE
jgi:hypothetical protein